MSNPGVSAALCTVAAAWIGYMIFFAAEAPSPLLAVAQWGFFTLAILGLVTALIRLTRDRDR